MPFNASTKPPLNKRWRTTIFLISFCFIFSCLANDKEAEVGSVNITSIQKNINLSPYIHVLTPDKTITSKARVIEQIKQQPRNSKPQLLLTLNDTDTWLYLKLTNNTLKNLSPILMLDYIFLEHAELYKIQAEGISLVDTLSMYEPLFQRTVPYRSASFELDLAQNTPVEYLIKLRFSGKKNHALEIRPRIFSQSEFLKYQLTHTIPFAIMMGVLLALIIYNSILYLKIGIKGHLLYSLYLSCYLFIIISYEGFFLYFAPALPADIIVIGMSALPIIASLCLIAFGLQVLNLKHNSVTLYNYYRNATIILAVLLPVTFLGFSWVNLLLELTVVSLTLSMGIFSAFLPRSKYKAAPLYAASFIFISIGYGIETISYSVPTLSLIGAEQSIELIAWFEQYFFYSCALIEMFFLALALATYIEQLRIDKKNSKLNELKQLKIANAIKQSYTLELELTVESRTKELTEKKDLLAKQNISLMESDKAKSNFLTNITHEFRTPLTLIQGPLQKILATKNTSIPQDTIDAITISNNNATRLSQLMEELLLLSQIETQQLTLKVRAYNLNEFIQQICGLFSHIAADNNINFKHPQIAQLDAVFFDYDKLTTILTNLLSNAFKYTPTGGEIKVELQQLTQQSSGSFVRINIIDNGPGIATEEQATVFNRFYRAEKHNDNIQGTGIGLALVKELVELHGGKVTLTSSEEGSIFSVFLPLGFSHFTEKELKNSGAHMPKNAEPVLYFNELDTTPNKTLQKGKPTILLVEDIQDMRLYIASHFSDNCNVIHACNGIEALACLAKNPVNLIISDIMMPKMDGMQLLQEAKEAYPLIPIIILSAKQNQQDKISALKAQADVYLTKPFHSEELVLMTQKLLASPPTLHKDETKEVSATTTEGDRLIEKIELHIKNNLGDSDFGVNELAQSVNMSKSTLHRRLAQTLNTTPAALLRNSRLEKAHHYITQQHFRTIAEVAYAVGFSHPDYFSRLYKQKYITT